MTLLAPLFLAGLFAVALPIWLHRLSSENPNRQPFSSLMFLEAGEPRRVLAKNVQYLLLLALRIAVLVLLALAFAQPALWRTPESIAGDDARLHIVVLDSSASMSYGSRWQRAQDQAIEVVNGLGSEDQGQLLASGRITELLAAETTDRALLRQSINTATPGEFFVDYGQLTRVLDGVLRGAKLPVIVHLITDAQESALPTRFAELAPRQTAELQIHNIALADEGNWVIESLVGSALSGELEAAVRSFSTQAADKTVRLELNGAVIDQRRITIQAGERTQVNFGTLDLAAGSNRVVVTLSPNDDMPADDSRIIALQRPEPRPVLLVSGDLRARDTLFLSSAMESLSALVLQVDNIVPGELPERTLSDYDFVVIADAADIGADASSDLLDYVESGGSVLMALGPRSGGLTVVPLTGQQFRSGGSGGVARVADYISVGALDASHSALREVETIRAAKFFRHTALEALAEDSVLITLENGDPLLLEREFGDGRVLLFTSSLDREWNDLPVQPAFVPLVAGLANHLLGGAGFSSEAGLGSTLALRAMGLQGGQIFDPEGDPALGLGGGTDDVLLDQIGFYEFVGGGNTELVAVNFDIRESDLTTLDPETIERWQGLGRSDAVAAASDAAFLEQESTLAPLGQWLLVILLLAFSMESLVGNWHLRVRRGIAA